MPLRLLLDAHLSRQLPVALRNQGFDAIAAQVDEVLRELSDEALLEEACRQGRAIVTYNIRHFQPLAQHWAQAERHHWGIILIHPKTIPQNDFRGQLHALEQLLVAVPDEDGLSDQTIFLAVAPQ